MREIELVVICTEIGEEVETLIQRPVRLGIRLVDLVQDHDRAEAKRQRLGGHEFRLRHRTLCRIDEQHNPIHH